MRSGQAQGQNRRHTVQTVMLVTLLFYIQHKSYPPLVATTEIG